MSVHKIFPVQSRGVHTRKHQKYEGIKACTCFQKRQMCSRSVKDAETLHICVWVQVRSTWIEKFSRHGGRDGRTQLCSRQMCSRSVKDAGTMFGFKSGAHVWMKSSVDTEKVLVRHSVACAVPSVRVVHVLWECPDCTGTLECTATLAIEHTVSLIGSMHNWLECVDFCVHSICVPHASTLCPDMGNFILLSSLVSFLSCNLHLSIFSLSVFSTSLLSHKHRLVYYHTWICSLAHYLYAHMYTCTTHSTHAIVSTQMHAYTCMHTYRSEKW